MRFLSKVSNKVFGDLCIFLIQYLVEIFLKSLQTILYIFISFLSIIEKIKSHKYKVIE